MMMETGQTRGGIGVSMEKRSQKYGKAPKLLSAEGAILEVPKLLWKEMRDVKLYYELSTYY